MTTYAELDKHANRWLNMEMRRRGFAVEKKLVYWRKRGPLFDCILPHILTRGELLRVHTTIWSPWIDNEEGRFTTFPPDKILIGGTLSEEFPEEMIGSDFLIADEPAIEQTFRSILSLVDTRLLSWFDSIDTCEEYMKYVGDRGFYPTPEGRAHIEEGIARAFRCEPLLW